MSNSATAIKDEDDTRARYDNYRLYRFHMSTEEQVKIFQNLEQHSDSVVFYGHARHVDQDLTVMVAAHKIAEITDLFKRYQVPYHILVKNIQEKIDAQWQTVQPANTSGSKFDWNHYFHLSTINSWLDSLPEKYEYVTPVVLGNSYEGRPIKGVKLSRKSGNTAIFLEGGIHAREWIAPATTTYIINQLLISNDEKIQELANNFDWYIFPVVNPDGYVYSFEYDRLWRKNRKPYGVCRGVDLNRNFDSHWGGPGSSLDPWRYDFAGEGINSEPEVAAIATFIQENVKSLKIRTFISLHSFSQLLMFPYGYTDEKVENYSDLKKIGTKSIEALEKRHGTKFHTGSINEIIYPSSGGSSDWVREKLDVKVSYTIELRGPPDSTDMFILPADQITPVGEETLDAFIALINEAKALGYYD